MVNWIVAAVSAAALTTTPAGAEKTPARMASYCAVPVDKLQSLSAENLVSYIQTNCQTGDVIQLPSAETYAMARLCDFDKAIVSGATVACVLIRSRELRFVH